MTLSIYHPTLPQQRANLHLSAMACFLCLILVAFGCKDAGTAPVDDYVNVPGMIVEASPHFFLIRTDPASGVSLPYFEPLNLSEELKINGLQIVFSGSLEAAPTTSYLYPRIRLSQVGVKID